MVALPLGREPLALRGPHRELELGVRPQRRILGERHGIVGHAPYTVALDSRTTVVGADAGGGVEQRPGLVDAAAELDHGRRTLDATP